MLQNVDFWGSDCHIVRLGDLDYFLLSRFTLFVNDTIMCKDITRSIHFQKLKEVAMDFANKFTKLLFAIGTERDSNQEEKVQ